MKSKAGLDKVDKVQRINELLATIAKLQRDRSYLELNQTDCYGYWKTKAAEKQCERISRKINRIDAILLKLDPNTFTT